MGSWDFAFFWVEGLGLRFRVYVEGSCRDERPAILAAWNARVCLPLWVQSLG